MKINNNNLKLPSYMTGLKINNNILKPREKEKAKSVWDIMSEDVKAGELKRKADEIAKKLARGRSITGAERNLLEKHAPEKLKKAEMANKRRAEVEIRLKHAKNSQEAKAIITEAWGEASQVAKGKDIEYTELISEAYNQVVEDYYNNRSSDSEIPVEKNIKIGSKIKNSVDVKI